MNIISVMIADAAVFILREIVLPIGAGCVAITVIIAAATLMGV
jgi:hypothetical protein